LALKFEDKFAFGDMGFSYARKGKGSPLLILHGAGGPDMWAGEFERLSEHFDVILPNHPGFDGSRCPDWLEAVEDLAYLYLVALSAWGLRDVRVVGHSLGGWIAGEMAIRSPQIFHRLVLVAPGGIRGTDGFAGNNFVWSKEETAEQLFQSDDLRQMFLAANSDEAHALTLHRSRETTARLVWSPRWIGPALNKWVRRIDTPTLFIWGKQDGLFPVAFGREFSGLLPDSDLIELDDCGHVPHLERPDEYRAAVDEFLEVSS